MFRSFLFIPAKGRKVDISVLPAKVDPSRLDTLERTRFLNVALLVVVTEVDFVDGFLKSNAFFLSRKSPKFLENIYLASLLSLRFI